MIDDEMLVRMIMRLRNAESWLNGPRCRLAVNDLSADGLGAYRAIAQSQGAILSVIEDLNDALRYLQPLSIGRVA